MGLVHEFEHQKRRWRRWELEGQPVEVKNKAIAVGESSCTISVIQWTGLHMLSDGVTSWLVDKSATSDAGRQGIGLDYTRHPETPATEEERQFNRRCLNNVIGQILPGFHLAEEVKPCAEA